MSWNVTVLAKTPADLNAHLDKVSAGFSPQDEASKIEFDSVLPAMKTLIGAYKPNAHSATFGSNFMLKLEANGHGTVDMKTKQIIEHTFQFNLSQQWLPIAASVAPVESLAECAAGAKAAAATAAGG